MGWLIPSLFMKGTQLLTGSSVWTLLDETRFNKFSDRSNKIFKCEEIACKKITKKKHFKPVGAQNRQHFVGLISLQKIQAVFKLLTVSTHNKPLFFQYWVAEDSFFIIFEIFCKLHYAGLNLRFLGNFLSTFSGINSRVIISSPSFPPTIIRSYPK